MSVGVSSAVAFQRLRSPHEKCLGTTTILEPPKALQDDLLLMKLMIAQTLAQPHEKVSET